MSATLDDIAKRLEHLERRMARLEALAGTGRTAPKAVIGNAPAPSGPTVSFEQPMVKPDPAPIAAANAQDESANAASVTIARGAPDTTPSPAAARPAPPTLRLAPIPPKTADDAFPDLSQLDEKVDPQKGPAQKLEVRSALEDYPRICARVQQLWGSPECEPYLNTLVIDTRGNRKGFPPAMMEELLYLGRLARALVILNIGGDLWDAYDQIGDRR